MSKCYSVEKMMDTSIDWYSVCESIPVNVKRHYWCHNCSEYVDIFGVCRHDKDLKGGESNE